MRKRFVAAIAAALVVLALAPATAQADTPPADVDCAVLAATLVGIDEAVDLSSGGTVGELLSGLANNPTSFNSFNNLVFIFSVGTISFSSFPELVSTLGSCGVMPLLVSLINA